MGPSLFLLDPNNNAKTVKGKLPGKDGKGGDKSAAKKPAKLDPATVKVQFS